MSCVRKYVVISCGAALLLTGCSTNETAEALVKLSEAARELSRAPSGETSGPVAELADITRAAITEAELEVRRRHGGIHIPWARQPWEPRVKRALDLTQIAVWASHRDAAILKDDIQAYLSATRSVVDRHRQSSLYKALPRAVRSNLAQAESATIEVSYLVEQGRLRAALERAEWAYDVAGGVDRDVEELLDRFRDPDKRKMWASWVESTVSESRLRRKPALVVDKHRRLAVLYEAGKPTAWLEVDTGRNSLRQKRRANDGATPEGVYHVTRKKGRGQTRFYKALLLDYPAAADYARFEESIRTGQIPAGSTIGGLIEIHGEGGRGSDWTDGCVAVSNQDMDVLFAKLALGSPVAIVGTYERWK